VAPVNKGLATPVALFVFNRPEPTRRVFAAIAAARPSVLLVVADGPRSGREGEAERVAAVRAIASAVDWPCDVRTNFATINMGCMRRVSSGIDWVFSQVDRAIIIEDDCLPSPTFFDFAEAMLDRYAYDHRVYGISGSNFSGDAIADGHYYSNFALMWGWATWRDRWAQYTVDPPMPYETLRRLWGRRPLAYLSWRHVFRRLTAGRIDTWDYQWILTVWRERAVIVRPTVNLVRNIGFGADATHTSYEAAGITERHAWDGDASLLDRAPSVVRADPVRDRVDERVWAMINWRTVLLKYMPWLSWSKRWIVARWRERRSHGTQRSRSGVR
jgi:hypothetical protein